MALLWVSPLVRVPETNAVSGHPCESLDARLWVSLRGVQETDVANAELVWFGPRIDAQDLQPRELTSPETSPET